MTLEVAEIFRRWGREYRRVAAPTTEQRRVMWAIEHCRTAALGGHLDHCTACGDTRPSYNSCRNRNCPKCQALNQDRWLEGRMRRVLPTHYFHVVFTLPAELRPLARRNPETVFRCLFRAASATLLELAADPSRLGGVPAVTCVLHTWTRELVFHPHIHCVVSGGGLSADGRRWVSSRPNHLFPLKVMARLFRAKLLTGLRKLRRERRLSLPPALEPWMFDEMVDKLFKTDWVVYAKRPFGGPEQVFAYLGRYTHRVGLSNSRLRSIGEDEIRFVAREKKVVRLPPLVFIRRLLQHVLPAGFVKLRHYGLVAASHATTLLEVARGLLEEKAAREFDDVGWRERFFRLTGVDLRRCTRCNELAVVRGGALQAIRAEWGHVAFWSDTS